MATEYCKPMLDVGSPRVLNCNVMTRRVLAKDSSAATFFHCKPFNNLVLIKDTLPPDLRRQSKSAIGTKLYFPFNENEIYEGGRTIFVNDKHLRPALIENFGSGAFMEDALNSDLRVLTILDRLPSLDPFLLKDVFLNEGIVMNEAYFEVDAAVWTEIERFIIDRFEHVVGAAFPDVLASDDRTRRLIQKIWEARDLVALKPLVDAFRLPENEALEIFAAWKGINFYAYQYERSKKLLIEFFAWLKNLEFPNVALPALERKELNAMVELIKTQLRDEWQKIETILRTYQDGYDKMFKYKTSSTEFVSFLKNSSKLYWDLGFSLGKTGHASYCWDVMSKRYKERKLPWEPLRELILLMPKFLEA